MMEGVSHMLIRACFLIFVSLLIGSNQVWSGVIVTPKVNTIGDKNLTSITPTQASLEISSSKTTLIQNDVEHAALSAVKEEKQSSQIENNKENDQRNNNTVSTKDSPNNTSVTLTTLDSNGDNKNETSDKPDEQDFLPEEGAAEKEHSSSLAIFFVLFVIILCVFFVHTILKYNCHHIPESLAIVFLGAVVGLVMKVLPTEDIKKVESFSPTMFFLVLLPPIIFESGYNLHKGKFRNLLLNMIIETECFFSIFLPKSHIQRN